MSLMPSMKMVWQSVWPFFHPCRAYARQWHSDNQGGGGAHHWASRGLPRRGQHQLQPLSLPSNSLHFQRWQGGPSNIHVALKECVPFAFDVLFFPVNFHRTNSKENKVVPLHYNIHQAIYIYSLSICLCLYPPACLSVYFLLFFSLIFKTLILSR